MGRKARRKERREPEQAPAPRRSEPRPPAGLPDPLERFALPLQAAAALAVLGVYVPTLYPSVSGGDSGELIVAAHELGVAHPPGYPLFTLLGHAFTLLPLGSIAWRVNFMTALLGAIAAAVLLRAAWRLTRSPGAGLFAAGLFAFSPGVWRYSIQAEVFSLNNLFAAALLSLLVSFEIERKASTLAWFGFWLALGLTNHHTLLFVGVPIGLWLLWRAPREALRWPRILRLPAWTALGFLPYLYLFVSPADQPSTTWGGTSTLSGFLAHLLRKQYGTLQLGTMEPGGSLGERLAAYLAALPAELFWVGPLLALVALGAAVAERREGPWRAVVAVSGCTLAFYLVVYGSLSKISLADPFWHEVYGRFWQQANLIVCLLAGCGLAWVSRFAGRRSFAAALVLAVALVGGQVARNHAEQDHSHDRLVADFAEAALAPLPDAALLVTKGDLYWNALRYKQVCEGVRRDVRILDVEMLKAPWMGDRVRRRLDDVSLPGRVYRAPSLAVPGSYDLAALFDANVAGRAVLSNALEHGDGGWKRLFTAWPEGPFDRLVDQGAGPDLDAWLARTDAWLEAAGLEFPDNLPAGSWERIARGEYLNVERRRGTRLLTAAVEMPLDPRYVRKAAEILGRTAVLGGEPSAPLYLNLGIAHYLLRGQEPGAARRMVEAWTTYLRLAPPEAAEREMVARVLRDPQRAEIGIGSR